MLSTSTGHLTELQGWYEFSTRFGSESSCHRPMRFGRLRTDPMSCIVAQLTTIKNPQEGRSDARWPQRGSVRTIHGSDNSTLGKLWNIFIAVAGGALWRRTPVWPDWNLISFRSSRTLS